MLVGCGGSPGEISEMKDATPADSMMYYFGEMQAYNYWQDAESDTMLRSEDAREEFMKGFRAGLGSEKDNSAYNKGVQLGLRLAMRLREFENRYGYQFSEEILTSSLENHLKSVSSREAQPGMAGGTNAPQIDIVEAQKGFYLIKDRLELNAANTEVEAAKVNLVKESKALDFEMVSDTLYARDITPAGKGALFKDGDKVAVEVTASTLDGREIVARQFPDSLTVGEGRVPRIVCLGIHTMTDGQTRQFMTTPRTLFGKRYAVYNLPFDEPVIFTVKAYR